MRTLKAILPDAEQIHDWIAGYSHDGTLLPRTLAELCENVRDLVVLEDSGRIIGCGALHLYGTHLRFGPSRSLPGPKAKAAGGW
jgi:amino-acid N-acetyltransferase